MNSKLLYLICHDLLNKYLNASDFTYLWSTLSHYLLWSTLFHYLLWSTLFHYLLWSTLSHYLLWSTLFHYLLWSTLSHYLLWITLFHYLLWRTLSHYLLWRTLSHYLLWRTLSHYWRTQGWSLFLASELKSVDFGTCAVHNENKSMTLFMSMQNETHEVKNMNPLFRVISDYYISSNLINLVLINKIHHCLYEIVLSPLSIDCIYCDEHWNVRIER